MVQGNRDRPTRLEAAAAVGGRGGGADLAAGDSGEGRSDSEEGRARQAATRPGLNHGLPRDRPGVPPDQAQVLEQGDRAGPGHRRVAGQVSRPETSAGGASLALPGGRIRRRLAHPATGTFFSHLPARSEEHTSELQSQSNLVCRLLLEKKKQQTDNSNS